MAWADRFLTPGEAARIRNLVQNQDWLEAEAREALARWLDPDAPPDAAELNQVLVTIRQLATGLPDLARLSLAELGVELAKAGGARDGTPRPAALEALRSLEDALGLAGHEASRALLDDAGIRAPAAVTPLQEPTLDVQAMNRLLDGEHWVTRRQVLELLSGPEFRHDPDLGRAEYRERVWSWCRQLALRGWGALAYPREYGGAGDLARAITVFETLAFHDLSLTTKFGVQFGLFGGSLLGLGTGPHHERYLRDVGTLALPGCFAMTETGHGSNVRDVETVARYDARRQEFAIDTPSESARKDYIGGAALHARMAVVFAQLEVNGAAHGVHAFLVPLRDDRGRPLPGVRIEDCGEKPGLNGVDNGRISFFAVRIPRENLLDRFGQVSPEGAYTSPIASPSRRFFTMLGALVAGRVSIAAAALSVAKTGLTIACVTGQLAGSSGRPAAPNCRSSTTSTSSRSSCLTWRRPTRWTSP
ncbi:MAG: acyl-CoA dehydrogenase family protein [Gemmatimonadetes bacterium]|nr:acyl-CoA dehydrogenase family protein [Gemmatimonadota bacterium]